MTLASNRRGRGLSSRNLVYSVVSVPPSGMLVYLVLWRMQRPVIIFSQHTSTSSILEVSAIEYVFFFARLSKASTPSLANWSPEIRDLQPAQCIPPEQLNYTFYINENEKVLKYCMLSLTVSLIWIYYGNNSPPFNKERHIRESLGPLCGGAI
jgi:hypothetical protein